MLRKMETRGKERAWEREVVGMRGAEREISRGACWYIAAKPKACAYFCLHHPFDVTSAYV